MTPQFIAALAVGISSAAFACACVAHWYAGNPWTGGLYAGLAIANGSLTMMGLGYR